MKKLLLRIIMLALLSQTGLSDQLDEKYWLVTTAGLGVAAGLELYGKDHLVSNTPKWDKPSGLDASFREKLWWGVEHQELAALSSDALLYGVSMSSLIWAPLAAQNGEDALHVNLRVFTWNSIATNLVKIYTARSRPYAHYGTRVPQGPRDNTSFFSGHSSVAFSQAVANSMLLSQDFPEHRELIWSGFMLSAGATAYLRVAGDMHYVSDVVVGSVVGGVIAWIITDQHLKQRETDSEDEIMAKPGGQSGNLLLMIKIPLG